MSSTTVEGDVDCVVCALTTDEEERRFDATTDREVFISQTVEYSYIMSVHKRTQIDPAPRPDGGPNQLKRGFHAAVSHPRETVRR